MLRSATLLALALGLGPLQTHGQSVLVRVSDAESGRPLQGALIRLEDAAGERVGSAFSDALGRFPFLDLTAGAYAVTVELIGYTSARSEASVGVGENALVAIALEPRAIELVGFSVEGEERCEVRPESGLTVAQVWDEVRKALEAARWTDERGVYEYRTRRYSRNVEEETGRVFHQQSERGRAYQRTPYESRAARDLIDNGFVQDPDGEPGEAFYYAPDAAVVLSDAFLDTHCMRLRVGDGDEAGLVGVVFQPVGGRRTPDISGTFWVDPETWRLSHLEYSYVRTRPDIETHGTGGEVTFQLLPNGTWIVPEWRIRAPWLARGRDGRGRETVYQHGYHDEGATILSVREPGGTVLFTAETAALEGVVVGEGSGRPVADADVSLDGYDERTTSDSGGRFRFTDVPAGDYTLTVTPPGAFEHALPPTSRPVTLPAGQVASVTVMASDALSVHAAACEREVADRPEEAAFLVGRVTERASGIGLEGARVSIRSDAFEAMDSVRYAGASGLVATTDADGRYRACVVPADAPLVVSARWLTLTTREDTVHVPDRERGLVHDISIDVGMPAPLVVEVRQWRGGQRVSTAQVRVAPVGAPTGADPEVLTTDASGRFASPDVGVGLRVLEVSAPGYATVFDTIQTRDGRATHVTVRLPQEAVEIEGVLVEVEARLPRLESTGYYERRRQGLGVFLDADDIRPRLPTSTTHLFDRTPGIQIGSLAGQLGARDVVVIGNCLPAIFIDGIQVRKSGPFDRNPNPMVTGRLPPEYLADMVTPAQIAGIEVYRSPAELPTQYTGRWTECGLILVWTH